MKRTSSADSEARADAAAAQADATTALTRLPSYVIMPDEWTDASALFASLGNRLELRHPSTFATTSSPLVTPGPGWAYLNSSLLASADTNITTAGAYTATPGAVSSVWGSASQTAPCYYRTRTSRAKVGRRQFALMRIACPDATGTGHGHVLCVFNVASPGNFARIGFERPSGSPQMAARYNASSPLTAALGQSSMWACIEVDGLDVRLWYANSGSTTEPAAGAFTLGESGTGVFAAGVALRWSILSIGTSHTGTMTGFRTGILRDDWSAQREGNWGCEDLSTAGYVLSRQVTVPTGATITDAALRAALASAVVTSTDEDIPGTGWTARAKRGGAPSGAYAALGSVAQEATTGADLYVDMKFTSDGTTRGALGPVFIRQS